VPNVWPTLLWGALLFLVALGVAAVVLRLAFLSDAASQLEPLRQAFTGQRSTGQRLADLADFDGRFAENRGMTALHVIPGGILLILVPLQLSTAMRNRFAVVHRWNGRLLIAAGILAAITGLYFGTATPFGGIVETAVIVLVGMWFLLLLLRAYRAIKGRDIDLHRRWMLRAIAAPIGVTVVRVVGPIADLALTPLGASARVAFVVSLCIGWTLTFAVTEWWLRRTPVADRELSFRIK
jgi:uncharacterized membrane protein